MKTQAATSPMADLEGSEVDGDESSARDVWRALQRMQSAADGGTLRVSDLALCLGNSHWAVRRHMALELVVSCGRRAVPSLRASMAEPGPSRPLAALALAQIDSAATDDVIAFLVTELETGADQSAEDAAWALAELGDAATAASVSRGLIRCLSDPGRSPDARIECVRALPTLAKGDAEAIPALIAAAGHEDIGLKLEALRALCLFGRRAAAAEPYLRGALASETEPTVRAEVLRTLGATVDPARGAIALLIEGLQDDSELVRVQAARSLGWLHGDGAEAIPTLLAALDRGSTDLSRNAIAALGEIGRPEPAVIAHLVRALGKAELAGLAAETLAHLGSPAEQALSELSDGETAARPWALYGLSKMTPRTRATQHTGSIPGPIPEIGPTEMMIRYVEPAVSPDRRARFEDLAKTLLAQGRLPENEPIETLPFLRFLVEHHPVVLHGSNQPALSEIYPVRKSRGGDMALSFHASTEPVWALFFAVLRRDGLRGPTRSGCVEASGEDGARHFYFALTPRILRSDPWQDGWIYVLPRVGLEWHDQEWVGYDPVRPLASLRVSPGAFPFKTQMMALEWHDEIRPRSVDFTGFPYSDVQKLIPLRTWDAETDQPLGERCFAP